MTPRPIGWPGLWGVLGFTALIGQAIYRLTPFAIDALRMSLAPTQWGVLAAWVGFMVYSEGYRGFQQKVAPRVAARAVHLTAHPRPVFVALAPLYIMGLVHATRRRLVTSWCVLVGIIGLVVIVRRFDQPWRGIVDAGVVLGLVWGVVAILVLVARAARGVPVSASPEVP
jgi:hypothetical protein